MWLNLIILVLFYISCTKNLDDLLDGSKYGMKSGHVWFATDPAEVSGQHDQPSKNTGHVSPRNNKTYF